MKIGHILIATAAMVVLLAVAATYVLPSIDAKERPEPYRFALAR